MSSRCFRRRGGTPSRTRSLSTWRWPPAGHILDDTGSATRNVADPAFDGDPVLATQEEIDEYGTTRGVITITVEEGDTEAAKLEETLRDYTERENRRFMSPTLFLHSMTQNLVPQYAMRSTN